MHYITLYFHSTVRQKQTSPPPPTHTNKLYIIQFDTCLLSMIIMLLMYFMI